MKNYRTEIEPLWNKARELSKAGEYSDALTYAEQAVEKIEKSGVCTEDDKYEYHCFDEVFENVLYSHMFEPEKELKIIDEPLSRIYLDCGALLYEAKRFDDAMVALEKGMKWNPMDARIRFEYGEVFKVRHEMESFFEITKETMPFLFRFEDMARCYRNLGFYFIETKKYDVAMALYLLSLHFEYNEIALSEMEYIKDMCNDVKTDMSTEEILSLIKQEQLYLMPAEHVLNLAYSYGNHMLENDMKDGAKYFFEIVYKATKNKKVEEILRKL